MEKYGYLWLSNSLFICTRTGNFHSLYPSKISDHTWAVFFYYFSACHFYWNSSLVFLWTLVIRLGSFSGLFHLYQSYHFYRFTHSWIPVSYFCWWWKLGYSWHVLATLITPHSHQHYHNSAHIHIFTRKPLFSLALFWLKLAVSLERRVIFQKILLKPVLCGFRCLHWAKKYDTLRR